MKKHSAFVPLELSGAELEDFVTELKTKLYLEFWSGDEENSEMEEIKSRIERNIYSVLESSLK
jgi:hypothetical protein